MDLTQISEDTLEMTKGAFNAGGVMAGSDIIAKVGMTQSLGIVGYNLEAPSKKLYPVLAPLRNRFARVMAPVGASAVNWKVITAINSAKLKASVAFGTRNNKITYATADKSATYKTLGLDSQVEFESIWQSRNFEDVRAYDALATLQSLMIEEEKLILGGNITALPAPSGLAGVQADTGGTLAASTAYSVRVSALTLFGYMNGATGNGGADSAGEGLAATQVSVSTGANAAATHSIVWTWTSVPGAFAYNVYSVSAATTGHKYTATVTSNTYTLTAVPGSGNAVNSADATADTKDFDGLYAQLTAAGAGTYIKDMAGATLTGDNAGGITQFDDLLQSLWDNRRIGPTIMLVNSKDALSITKAIGASSNLAYRVMLSDGRKDVVGGIFISGYLNKFTSSLTPGSPDVIPILIHPYLPPGTILFLSERLPYPNNNVPNVFELDVLQEYTDYQFAVTTRNYEHGVYCHEVLKVFFPAGCGIIRGVA